MSSNKQNSQELLAKINQLIANEVAQASVAVTSAPQTKAKTAKARKAAKVAKAPPAKKARTREEVLASLVKAREVAAAKRAAAAKDAEGALAAIKLPGEMRAAQQDAKPTKPATKRPVRADKTLPTPAEMLEAIYRKVVG